jgi:hypothetical protein
MQHEVRDGERVARHVNVPFVNCTVKAGSGGLGVYANERIAAGSIILTERPFVLTPSWAHRRNYCAVCVAKAPGEEAWRDCCDGCQCVAFCSAACADMAANDELHSACECAALAAFANSKSRGLEEDEHEDDNEEDEDEDGTDEEEEDDEEEEVADLIFQAIRILSHRFAGQRVPAFPESDPCLSPVSYDDYSMRLQAIRLGKSKALVLKRAVTATLRYLPPEARVPPKELFDVLNRHQCNVYGVLGPGGCSVGMASFIGGLHTFNHSCMPNAVFDSLPLRNADHTTRSAAENAPAHFALRALMDISIGEEICHCYAASTDGPSQRLQYLQVHYGFECQCPRCSCDDPGEEADLSEHLDALRCICDGCGTGLSYPLTAAAEGVAAGGDAVPACRLLQCVLCGGRWEQDEDEY